jgi:hypothetical protein
VKGTQCFTCSWWFNCHNHHPVLRVWLKGTQCSSHGFRYSWYVISMKIIPLLHWPSQSLGKGDTMLDVSYMNGWSVISMKIIPVLPSEVDTDLQSVGKRMQCFACTWQVGLSFPQRLFPLTDLVFRWIGHSVQVVTTWERGGAVVKCRPHDQEVVGSIPSQVTT